ncbi:MAG: glycosyltransferase [Anaerolineae bacterium]|jgi:glycosyltransferase involved in cell wall biosynthesis
MKILYVVHQFFPEFVGGTEQDTLAVASEMQRRGHRVAVFHRAPGPAGLVTSEQAGIQVTRVQAGPMTPGTLFLSTFRHPGIHRAFRQAFHEMEPDLVHVQHLRGLPAGIVSWTRRMGRPVVISLRDFWFVCPNAQLLTNTSQELCGTPGVPRYCAACGLARLGLRALVPLAPLLAPLLAARNRLLLRTLEQANALLAFSRFVERWYAGQGMPGEILHHIGRGVPRPARLPSRRRSEDGVRFVYAGGLSWQKGVHILVDAFNTLPGTAELVIAGDETQYPSYVRTLKEAARHPGIRFTGRLDREQVWQALVDADVVVVPSLWFETFSMLTHEAFAAGVPVVASAHGALEEAVRHDVDGLLVPPGNVAAWRESLQRLIDDPDLLRRLRSNVRPPVAFQDYVAAIDNLYHTLSDL